MNELEILEGFKNTGRRWRKMFEEYKNTKFRTFIIKEVGKAYDKRKITDSNSAFKIFKEIFDKLDDDKEHFVILYLDSAHNISYYKIISTGGLDNAAIDVQSVVRSALLTNCIDIIVAHNHPSGNLEPSCDDLEITEKIDEALKLFKIKLLDHLILSKNKYVSMKDEHFI